TVLQGRSNEALGGVHGLEGLRRLQLVMDELHGGQDIIALFGDLGRSRDRDEAQQQQQRETHLGRETRFCLHEMVPPPSGTVKGEVQTSSYHTVGKDLQPNRQITVPVLLRLLYSPPIRRPGSQDVYYTAGHV